MYVCMYTCMHTSTLFLCLTGDSDSESVHLFYILCRWIGLRICILILGVLQTQTQTQTQNQTQNLRTYFIYFADGSD
jgi:hypothetical protein